MNQHPRRILTPGPSRKRKEMEAIYPATKPPQPPPPPSTAPVNSNRLLAGYIAHEFLTKGTLLGQKWDPARAGPVPVSSMGLGLGENKKMKVGKGEAEPSRKVKQQLGVGQTYAEMANLVKGDDGAHVPGIVNPTQLARWIQM